MDHLVPRRKFSKCRRVLENETSVLSVDMATRFASLKLLKFQNDLIVFHNRVTAAVPGDLIVPPKFYRADSQDCRFFLGILFFTEITKVSDP